MKTPENFVTVLESRITDAHFVYCLFSNPDLSEYELEGKIISFIYYKLYSANDSNYWKSLLHRRLVLLLQNDPRLSSEFLDSLATSFTEYGLNVLEFLIKNVDNYCVYSSIITAFKSDLIRQRKSHFYRVCRVDMFDRSPIFKHIPKALLIESIDVFTLQLFEMACGFEESIRRALYEGICELGLKEEQRLFHFVQLLPSSDAKVLIMTHFFKLKRWSTEADYLSCLCEVICKNEPLVEEYVYTLLQLHKGNEDVYKMVSKSENYKHLMQ